MKTLKHKVLFSGGGTLGPVTPLLAIHETIREAYPGVQFLWVGTHNGPEKELIEKEGIDFHDFASGKLRRYMSIWNIVDMFRIFVAFFESLVFLHREKPSLCISAGGYVSVPLHWAALVLRIPTWVHQQDVRVGLSNKLMAPGAKVITVAVEKNLKSFSKKKVRMLGSPIRQDILLGDKRRTKIFGLKPDLPVLFITGGGTGSEKINNLTSEIVDPLQGVCQIIHLAGIERAHNINKELERKYYNYQVYQFFTDQMKHAYAVSDLIISRGGFGSLTEMAAMKKPAIIIPKPGHQEDNVGFLEDAGAVELVDERTASGVQLVALVKKLLNNEGRRAEMGEKLHSLLPVAQKRDILEVINKIVK